MFKSSFTDMATTTKLADHGVPQRNILFVKTANGGRYPVKAHPNDAGYDLHAELKYTKWAQPEPLNDIVTMDGREPVLIIEPGQTKVVGTGLYICFPNDYYGSIVGRSSHSLTGLMVATGTVDPKYRAEVGVIMCNCGDKTRTIHHGDRIAQLLLCPLMVPGLHQVHTVTQNPKVVLMVETPTGEWIAHGRDYHSLRRDSRGQHGFGSSNFGPQEPEIVVADKYFDPPEHEYTKSFQHDLDGTTSDDDYC